MTKNANVCACETCPGAGCNCGCQTPKTEKRAGCQCGSSCSCGPNCTCKQA
jgi:hypothetical protein